MSSAAHSIAEKLLHIQAVKLQPNEPFTWASGWKSPIYCDNRRALSFPSIRDFIKSELAAVIFEQFADVDCIAGVATAGISWGAMVADQLKLPFVYVRPKPKEHGMGNQIEGALQPNAKVLVLEDLISTGKSSLQVCDVLTNNHVQVAGMVSIFNYGFADADAAFKQAGVQLVSLSNYAALVEVAKQKNLFSQAEIDVLLQWQQNPSNWNK
jgi:orotate phosphoribosyltransferase